MSYEVFLSPHTDDETIGMAGAICDALDVGHEVIVVLVTDNKPSARGSRLFPDENLDIARRQEWINALLVLGVDKIEAWDISEANMEVNPAGAQEEIVRRMHELGAKLPVVHFHTVWGRNDVHASAEQPTLAHVICANAAMVYHQVHPLTRLSLHGVYVYSHPMDSRRAPMIHHLSPKHMAKKVAAADCFRSKTKGIGYGYASVPELFDAATTDPREFVQEIV